jgi:hypothetical protein
LIKIKKLQDFIKKTGKYPSQKSKDKEESRLAIFCQDSRTRRRKGDLNEISIKRFNDMNFVWEPYKSNFEDNLLKVAEFIEEHKRPPMIRYSKNKKERALAEWLNTQLEKSNEGKITPEEIKKMKTLNIKIEEIESAFQNIIDNKEKDAWMQNFEKVKKIKIEKNRWPYGSRYRGEGWREEVGLYAWLYKQRKDFKSKVLQDWKKEKLDEIGEWQPKTDKTSYDEIWLENFEKLKSFVKKNNRFPTAMIKGTEERVLTNWCGTQRNLYYGRLKNYAPLPKWRIDKMNSIGFDWGGEVERKSFADRFNELKNWIQQHDGAYPKTQRKKNDLKINPERQEENSLYEWLARQNRRKDKGELTNEEEDLLSTLPKPQEENKNLNLLITRVDELKEWLTKNNGEYPCWNTKNQQGISLYGWVYRIRKKGKNNKLTEEELKLLKEIGFRF